MMKNMMIALLFAASGMVSCAQEIPAAAVPAVVLNSFQQQFPKALDVEWEKKGAVYEVDFETGLAGRDHEVWLDSLGKVLRHKEEISASELPEAVKKAISQQFPGFVTEDVSQINTGGVITYRMELKQKPKEWKVVFDANGKVLEQLPD